MEITPIRPAMTEPTEPTVTAQGHTINRVGTIDPEQPARIAPWTTSPHLPAQRWIAGRQ